jgi:hypothetical protein
LDNYDSLQFGSIAHDIRDLPAQGPHPLEAVYVWAGLGDKGNMEAIKYTLTSLSFPGFLNLDVQMS